MVIVSTGGGDFTHPRGTATKVDGGYRINGRKLFVSQAPVGVVLSTMFAFDDPEPGQRVLNLAVPFASEGVAIDETWDALGMRGTAGHDVTFDDVFVPDGRVLANRPYGVLDPALQVIASIAMPIIAAVYLGVAQSACEQSIAAVTRPEDPIVQRQVGLMANRLRVASWALDGALRTVGDDLAPSLDTVAAVMTAKREVALAGIEACDLAMDVAGGSAFRKGSPIERAYRDLRAAKFHPFTMEATLVHTGQLALGGHRPRSDLTAWLHPSGSFVEQTSSQQDQAEDDQHQTGRPTQHGDRPSQRREFRPVDCKDSESESERAGARGNPTIPVRTVTVIGNDWSIARSGEERKQREQPEGSTDRQAEGR